MKTNHKTDTDWMRQALSLAEQGAVRGEVPVGALVVADGELVGQGWNQPISSEDPTAHAEIVALRDAAKQLGNYRLAGCTLYVTIEPCTMCIGALIHARIARLVYGASEPRAGAVQSQMQLLELTHYNHRIEVVSGVLKGECAEIMQQFFRQKRQV